MSDQVPQSYPTVNTAPGLFLPGPVFNVASFAGGAIIDGGNVDTDFYINMAFAAATLARAGTIYFPVLTQGRYRHSTALSLTLPGPVANAHVAIVFAPGAQLEPTVAVTTAALQLQTNGLTKGELGNIDVYNLRIDGTACGAGVTGCIAGGLNAPASPSGQIRFYNSQFVMFNGANSVGAQTKNTVNVSYMGCTFARNTIDAFVDGDIAIGLPTLTKFYDCVFYISGDRNLVIGNAYRTTVLSCTFEGAAHQAIHAIATGGKSCIYLSIEDCWFEGNSSDPSYEVECDGAGGQCAYVSIRNCNWNSAARSIHFNSVANFVLDNITPRATAHSVVIEANCRGAIVNWPENNIPYNTAVDNLAVSNGQDQLPQMSNKVRWTSAGHQLPTAVPAYDIGSDVFRFRAGYFVTVNTAVNPVAYSANMTPDAALGNIITVTATNGVAFTINAPINPITGQLITLVINNSSGGVQGAVTFAGAFVQNGYTVAASTKEKSTQFRWTGANWKQVGAWSLDI